MCALRLILLREQIKKYEMDGVCSTYFVMENILNLNKVIPLHAMKAFRGGEVQLYSFSALDEGE
jgi:hypothetical protein